MKDGCSHNSAKETMKLETNKKHVSENMLWACQNENGSYGFYFSLMFIFGAKIYMSHICFLVLKKSCNLIDKKYWVMKRKFQLVLIDSACFSLFLFFSAPFCFYETLNCLAAFSGKFMFDLRTNVLLRRDRNEKKVFAQRSFFPVLSSKLDA